MGLAFLGAGAGKLLGGGFNAAGYLANAPRANGSPAADLFVAMAQTPWFVGFANVAVPRGQVLIGLGLLVGRLTRLAAFWGTFQMVLFYLGNWDVATVTATVTSRTCWCSSRSPRSAPAESSASTAPSNSTRSADGRSSNATPGPDTSSGESPPDAGRPLGDSTRGRDPGCLGEVVAERPRRRRAVATSEKRHSRLADRRIDATTLSLWTCRRGRSASPRARGPPRRRPPRRGVRGPHRRRPRGRAPPRRP